VPTNKSAAADYAFDETALSGLDIAARGRGEVERQARPSLSAAASDRRAPDVRRDVGRNRIGDSGYFGPSRPCRTGAQDFTV
jgi:hypothetical protein